MSEAGRWFGLSVVQETAGLVMRFMFKRRLAVAAILTSAVAFLAFGGVSLGGQSRQAAVAGATDTGATGIDLDCPAVTCPDFGIDQQLNKAANPALDDAHVIVVASQCSDDDTPLVGGLGCDNGDGNVSQSEDEDTTLCRSTWANGQLPNNPKAVKGHVCVYVLGGANFGHDHRDRCHPRKLHRSRHAGEHARLQDRLGPGHRGRHLRRRRLGVQEVERRCSEGPGASGPSCRSVSSLA